MRATGLMKTSSNTLRIDFTGVPGGTYKIQSSSTATSSAFQDAGVIMQAAPDGSFVYEDATAFSSLQRFYRAVSVE